MAERSAAFNIIFGAKTDGLEAALKTVDGRLRRTAASFSSTGRKLTAGLTAPLAAIGTSSFQAAANFEQEMAKVRAVSGASAAEFQALSDNARKLGASTRYSATEVAQLSTEFAKLGFSAQEITQVTGATLSLAQASGSDLARSAEVAGSTLRAFGMDASQTGTVTDVMAASFSSTALDLESFAESVKYVAPVARAAGLGIEETTAYLGVLANNGIKGSQAGTALRRILSELAGTGQNLGDVLASTAGETITLADAKDEVGRSAQSAYLILRDGLKDVDGLTNSLKDSKGAAAQMAATMDDTALGGIARMRSAIEGAQISIGEALAPTVLEIVGKIEDLASAFGRLPKSTQEAAVKFGAFAAALGPGSMAVGQLVTGFKNLVPALAKVNKIVRANPWTIYAAAIAGAIALIVELTDEVDAAEIKQEKLTSASKKAADQYEREAGKVNALVTQYKYAGDDLERRKKILKQLQDLSPSYFGNLNAETTNYETLAGAVQNYNERIRQAAIAKAFGEQLTDVEAERIKVAEKLFQAEMNLAQAQEELTAAEKDRKVVAQDGTTNVDKAENRVRVYQVAIQDLKEEQEGLTAASDELNAAIARASASMEGLDAVGGSTNVGDLLTRLEGMAGAAPVPVKVKPKVSDFLKELDAMEGVAPPLPVSFDITPGALDEVLTDLGDQLGEAAARLTLGEDEITNLQTLAGAYADAAVEALVLGDPVIAQQLQAQADAMQAQADALQAQADGAQAAINQINALGGTVRGTTANIHDLLGALHNMDGVATTTGANVQESNDKTATSYRSLGEAMGSTISSGIADAIRGEKEMGAILRDIGRQLLATLLSETIGLAIRNSFQTAGSSGPAAAIVGPALAATAVSTVSGLFNDIPALATGGITTGPTLALIGDNPGGKEAVIPLNRLERMMAGSAQDVNVTIHGRLQGSDLLVAGDRAKRLTRRLGRR